MVNFYHRFVPHCAQLMQPLHELLAPSKVKSQTVTWNEVAEQAFNNVKDALANATMLHYPKVNAPTCLVTDASDSAVGAVLQQYDQGTWQPLSFFSKKLSNTERRYSTFDRELLAVYLAIKHFRHLLEGRHFHVLTDHKPLHTPSTLAPIIILHGKHDTWTIYPSSRPRFATSMVRITWWPTPCHG